MSTRIALIGAGGKMGCRLTDNFLKFQNYEVSFVEVAPPCIEKLRQKGVEITSPQKAVPQADIVILSVPDISIGKISDELVPLMKSNAIVMTLDPAAPLDGVIHHRNDLGYIIAHPCHPSVFNWEPTEEAFRDFYGGISARQSIVLALMHGNEAHYEIGKQVAQDMYQPVNKVHRITLDQMAMLEPAMVETLAQTCVEVIKEGYDRIVELGIPEAAARDFVLGHLRIQIAVLFNEVNGTFSDAAYKISKRAKPILFKEGWKRIFEMDDIKAQVKNITNTVPAMEK